MSGSIMPPAAWHVMARWRRRDGNFASAHRCELLAEDESLDLRGYDERTEAPHASHYYEHSEGGS